MNNSRTNTTVSNKAIVKQLYHNILQDNITDVLNTLADDVEWIFYGPSSIPMAGYYYGKMGVLQFFETANQVEQLEIFEPHEYIEGDNQVVVVGFQKATSIETGKSFN
ncbi:MAG: nuclear transport factor 2 family protein [Flavisolibacter sp.]|nr:nuclear transport factor 2 family protein [Flavisolibacter sp.]